MSKFLLALGGSLALGVLLFVVVLLTTLGGAFAGWLIFSVFDETFYAFTATIGLEWMQGWQFGAVLGFISGFFRSSSSSS